MVLSERSEDDWCWPWREVVHMPCCEGPEEERKENRCYDRSCNEGVDKKGGEFARAEKALDGTEVIDY